MNNTNHELLLYVIIGIAAMFVFGFSFLLVVVRSQRKKSQLQKSISKLRVEQQNQLIAILSSAKLHLLGIKADVLDEKDQKLHEKGRELLNDVIQKVRGISHNLHSNILKEFGLNEAIRHFVRKVTEGSMLNASTNLDDNYATENPENDISIYRIVQELINNTLKYANATEFLISSVLTGNELDLAIFHNGDGLTQEQFEELRYQKEGLGLKNIQNRIILLKGSIYFTGGTEGYRINIHVPVKSNQ